MDRAKSSFNIERGYEDVGGGGGGAARGLEKSVRSRGGHKIWL